GPLPIISPVAVCYRKVGGAGLRTSSSRCNLGSRGRWCGSRVFFRPHPKIARPSTYPCNSHESLVCLATRASFHLGSFCVLPVVVPSSIIVMESYGTPPRTWSILCVEVLTDGFGFFDSFHDLGNDLAAALLAL